MPTARQQVPGLRLIALQAVSSKAARRMWIKDILSPLLGVSHFNFTTQSASPHSAPHALTAAFLLRDMTVKSGGILCICTGVLSMKVLVHMLPDVSNVSKESGTF